MRFGVPNLRAKKREEQFPNDPVLTVGIDGGKGTSKSLILNNKACELLGLNDNSTVAFGFEEGKVFITNGDNENIPEEHRFRVTKGTPRKVSEKRTYTYISERVFMLDNSIENHFDLLRPVEDIAEGEPIAFELSLRVDSSEDNTVDTEPVEQANFAAEEQVPVESFNEGN